MSYPHHVHLFERAEGCRELAPEVYVCAECVDLADLEADRPGADDLRDHVGELVALGEGYFGIDCERCGRAIAEAEPA